jgi:hypothetical protein
VKEFTAALEAFANKTAAQMKDIARESVQDVVGMAQNNIQPGAHARAGVPVARSIPKGRRVPAKEGLLPVDTGFLRNSLVSGLNGSFGSPGPNSYALAIEAMDLGDIAQFHWAADYAMHVELGTSRMRGVHFVGTAAATWPEAVARNAARVKT